MPINFNFLFSFLVLLGFCHCSNILLQPIATGPELAIIFLEGAEIPCERYVPLSQKIQAKLPSNKVWVSIPSVILELPFEFTTNLAVSSAIKDLQNAGFAQDSPIYIMGHSLGGMAAADWGLSHVSQIKGIITLGSYLDRKYRDQDLGVPVLMIGGELDGLSRITRFAEEYYHRVLNKDLSQVAKTNPIVVVEGMNHMQFASGDPSLFVKLRDLKAENTQDASHDAVASVVAGFLSGNFDWLADQMTKTGSLLAPIIDAYLLEGSIHFNRPDQTNCSEGYCSKGSDWVLRAQEILAGKDLYDKVGATLEVTNDFVILSSLPPFGKLYHPKLIVSGNDAKMTTFSQCAWKILDKYLDTAFMETSANEIGSKMVSRQCSLVKVLNYSKEATPFSVDDGFDWCAEINKHALQWALDNSAKKTVDRYNQYGQKLTFGPDDKMIMGSSWVYTELEFKEDGDNMVLRSPEMATDIDAPPLPIFAPDGLACYHYCKLLSPARAVEWMYVDGLRKKYGISS